MTAFPMDLSAVTQPVAAAPTFAPVEAAPARRGQPAFSDPFGGKQERQSVVFGDPFATPEARHRPSDPQNVHAQFDDSPQRWKNRQARRARRAAGWGYGWGYGWGLGVRVMTDLGQSNSLTGLGELGWAGAASTYFWVDPAEEMTGVIMTQFLGSMLPLSDDMRVAAYQALP